MAVGALDGADRTTFFLRTTRLTRRLLPVLNALAPEPAVTALSAPADTTLATALSVLLATLPTTLPAALPLAPLLPDDFSFRRTRRTLRTVRPLRDTTAGDVAAASSEDAVGDAGAEAAAAAPGRAAAGAAASAATGRALDLANAVFRSSKDATAGALAIGFCAMAAGLDV